MKKYIESVLINMIVVILCYVVFLYPVYDWYLKAFFYTITTMGIIGYASIISQKEAIFTDPMYKELFKRRRSKIYMAMDLFFDFLFLAIFILLDYKFIFILYGISVILSITLYSTILNQGDGNE